MTSFYDAHGQEVATVDVTRINRDQVDLVFAIHGTDVSAGRRTISTDADNHERLVAVQPSPLALDSEQPTAYFEPEVIASVLSDRFKDGNPKSRGGQLDLKLGYGTLDVR